MSLPQYGTFERETLEAIKDCLLSLPLLWRHMSQLYLELESALRFSTYSSGALLIVPLYIRVSRTYGTNKKLYRTTYLDHNP